MVGMTRPDSVADLSTEQPRRHPMGRSETIEQSLATWLVCHARPTSSMSFPISCAWLTFELSPRPEVLVTLTTDEGKVGAALHGLKSGGESDLMTGIQVAQVRGEIPQSSLRLHTDSSMFPA